jgi:type IV pilus assembly protein PilM
MLAAIYVLPMSRRLRYKVSILDLNSILKGTKDIVGLDIGSSSVKCVLLEAGENGYSVLSASIAEIDKGNAGSPDQTENIISAISHCIDTARVRTKYVTCGICGPEVAVRRFYFPKLDEKDLAIEIIYEAEQVCPFESGQFIVDHEVMDIGVTESDDEDDEGETNGILVAATRNLVVSTNQLIRKATLNCVMLDVNSLALLNCFTECEKPESGMTFGVLDIGSKFMNLVISNDNALPFVRDIPNASDRVIDHIAEQTDYTTAQVRTMLRDHNSLSDEILKGLNAASAILADDIRDSLIYYKNQDGNTVDRLYVCGGFAQTKGLVELLGNDLPCETVLWDPFEKIEIKGAQRNKSVETITQYGPSLAMAAGLAMRSI